MAALYKYGRALYGCTGCNKTLSRKCNTDRHNYNLHDEKATVYNIETCKKSYKRKTNKNSSSSLTEADAITNTRQIPNRFNNNPEEFDFNKSYSEVNKNTDEKIFKI
jgi:hypothetical protein